jgi:asparagine synthase (glutamine-hydrolysing)
MHWGQECLSRFNGMFAFLIWDAKENELFGARDRFGEKPFYYAGSAGQVLFASEIKALFPMLGQVPAFRPEIARAYLQQGIADFSSQTFYQGIFSLPAAHQLCVRAGRIQVSRYWQLEESESFDDDPIEAFRWLLFDSIRLRTRSDVPIGTCLSGGLDSGSIVCGLAQMLGEANGQFTRKTFTAAYPDYDESKLAALVNEHSRSCGHATVPEPRSLAQLEQLLWFHDEPFHSFAAFAGFEVMRLARQHGVVVLLNGQGADELLGGYPPFLRYYLFCLLRRGHTIRALAAARGAQRLSGQGAIRSLLQALKVGLQEVLSDTALMCARSRFLQRRHAFRRCCFQPDFLAGADRHQVERPSSPISNPFKRQLHLSLFGSHLPLYLRVEDRNSMAHSIESRQPFLDHRLAERVFTFPTEPFMRHGENKHLLREAMRGILPQAVRSRPEKDGFPVPQMRWMRKDLRDEIRELLNSSEMRSRGIFDMAALQCRFEEFTQAHAKGDAPPSDFWLRVIFFELWLRARRRYETEPVERDSMIPATIVNAPAEGTPWSTA